MHRDILYRTLPVFLNHKEHSQQDCFKQEHFTGHIEILGSNTSTAPSYMYIVHLSTAYMLGKASVKMQAMRLKYT
jgi:hypothetical protein